MERIPQILTDLVTRRPWVTVGLLVLVTVVMAAGANQRSPVVEGAALEFLPPGHPIAGASAEIEEYFTDSGETTVSTLIFRGETLTPDGLQQMEALLNRIVADEAVGPLLAKQTPVIAPSGVIQQALQLPDLSGLTPEMLAAARTDPAIAQALSAMTGRDVDGGTVTIARITLTGSDEELIAGAERRINELARADEGRIAVSSISNIIVQDEYRKATEEGMAPLVGLAIVLIALLILLFLRTLSDLLLTLLGLVLALIWVVGAEGWLGPDGLGLIGAPSSLTTLVPVIVISLTVDYAIQAVSQYREQRTAGLPVVEAVGVGLRHVTTPLVLAAVTTIVSLLANLFSPISLLGDFGIVAGLGVGLSLIVMLTLLPAGRAIIDGRRERQNKLKPPRPVAQALPGIGRFAEMLGKSVTERPMPYIAGVVLMTGLLGWAASNIESGFDIRDILPRGGDVLTDMETLENAVGGSTEMATLLVRAEATDTRTFLNLRDLRLAFDDETRRPRAAAGSIHISYEQLVSDWVHDSGEPGDKYDAGLAELFVRATAGVELDSAVFAELLERLDGVEPLLSRVYVVNPDGLDHLLVQFPIFSNDPAANAAVAGGH